MEAFAKKFHKKIIPIFFLFLAVFVSGCITLGGGPGIQYKNDVITVEDYVITETNPIPGSTTTIKFLLRNNGDREVPRAVVDFYDTKGLKTSVNCKNENQLNDHSCQYTKIASFDDRTFEITFTIPNKEEIDVRGATTFNINYKIEYDYQGSRRITIPVIDDTRLKEPRTKYQTGQPSVGPIVAEFAPPVGRTTKKDSQVIKEYWGVRNSPFEIKVSFKNVGTTTVGQIKPVNISAGKATLKLTGLHTDSQRRCDFSGTSGTISSKFDITVPDNLVCNFIADFNNVCPPTCEKTVAVDALFSYTYSIQRSETLQITVERVRTQ